MILIKKILLVGMMMFFVGVGFAQNIPGQSQEVTQPSNTICSSMKRSAVKNTLWALFANDTDTFFWKYIEKVSKITASHSIDWWHPNWFNNDLDKKVNWCQNNGADWWWMNDESSWFGAFISANSSVIQSYFSNYTVPINGQIKQDKLRQLQSYVTWSCGIPLRSDGKLGVKTLNAIAYCKPPAEGYISWTDFKSIYTKLYTDENWKNILYTGNQFQWDPSLRLYIKKEDLDNLSN